jgi:hypothetical protein
LTPSAIDRRPPHLAACSAPPGNNIKVVVRLRPLSAGEKQRGALPAAARGAPTSRVSLTLPCAGERPVVSAETPQSLSVAMAHAAAGAPPGSAAESRSFRFEAVLAPGVSQAEVMTKCGVRHLLDSTLAGYTATVMAYGQTGSGKTFTMSGHEDQDAYVGDELDETGLQKDDGLILRSLAHLYARMEAAGGGKPNGPKFRVRASYLEIYNEAVYDLLDPGDPAQLQVRWDATRNAFHVPDARRVACDTLDDALLMVATGARNRRVGSHELNKDSSRSHAICAVQVETARAGGGPVTFGKISFVDLAGSERLKSSRSAGEQAKETGSINRSLMALGKVISALSEHGGRAGAGHIPYRDSKLTKLLMDSLGGGSLALMVACISPAIGAVDETLSTLTYATRAKNIVNTPVAASMGGANAAKGGSGGSAGEAEAMREENAALRRELEAALEENEALRSALEEARAGVADLGQAYTRGPSGLSDSGGPVPGAPAAERAASPPPQWATRSSSPPKRAPPAFEARFGDASREQLLALLAQSEGALEGAASENASLRHARNELQAEHAARAAEAEALAVKLRDIEACFLETERDGDGAYPTAVRRRMSTLLGPPPALLDEWDARGAERPSTAASEASLADESDAYYRARTAPPADVGGRRRSSPSTSGDAPRAATGDADEAAMVAACDDADGARVHTPGDRQAPAWPDEQDDGGSGSGMEDGLATVAEGKEHDDTDTDAPHPAAPAEEETAEAEPAAEFAEAVTEPAAEEAEAPTAELAVEEAAVPAPPPDVEDAPPADAPASAAAAEAAAEAAADEAAA